MSLSDLERTVAKYAPLLGSVLPIPGGTVIGQIIASAFGGDINKPDELIELIQKDPEAAIKLQQIESNERIEVYRVFADEKKNARDREIEYIKATGGKEDRTLKNLAYIVTGGFFATLYLLFFPNVQINLTERDLLLVLIGMLASKWQTMMDYFFGSSNKKD